MTLENLPSLKTIPQAAALLGIKPHALRRAVKLGLIPSYAVFNKRILVDPVEVLGIIAACEQGGQK